MRNDRGPDTPMLHRCIWVVALACVVSSVHAKPLRMAFTEHQLNRDEEIHAAVEAGDGVVFVGSVDRVGRGKDVLLKKVDTWGNVVWEKALGGTGDDVGLGITRTGDGYLVVTGHSASLFSDESLFLAKLGPAGGLQWARVLHQPNLERAFRGHAVIEDEDGNLVVTGRATHVLGPKNYSLLLAKYEPDGDIVFRTLTENPFLSRDPVGNDIADLIGSEGYLVVGAIDAQSSSDRRALVVRFGPNSWVDGAYAFGDTGGDDEAHAIVRMSDGDYAVAGATGSASFVVETLDTGADPALGWKWRMPSTTAYSLTRVDTDSVVAGRREATSFYLSRFDASGTLAWNRAYVGGVVRSVVPFDDAFWLGGFADGVDRDTLLVKADEQGRSCLDLASSVVPMNWTPDEDYEPGLTANPAPDVQSYVWEPDVLDLVLSQDMLCFEAPCCTYEPPGECVLVYGPHECDDQGWPVPQCMGDSTAIASDDACEAIDGMYALKDEGETVFCWNPHPLDMVYEVLYDVALGDLGALRAAESFTGSVQRCSEDQPETCIDIIDDPLPGEGWWILVRGVWEDAGESHGMSYGSKNRDDQINADPLGCR